MERIGLFGGSFDPVHLGHLLVAQAAREALGLARVFFIPAAQSPFKADAKLAPANERLRLLRLALAAQPWCAVDAQEIHRGGVSYTIDTVRNFSARHAGAELFYLIGSDQVPLLPKWREADELARRLQFVIIPRPGEGLRPLPPPFRGQALTGFCVGVSASQIRERVRAGFSIDWLVPHAVAEAIHNNRLYL